MVKIKTERIDIHHLPMTQRKHIGMLCQRHMESHGNLESLCAALTNYIDAHQEPDTRAARWMLARLIADPISEKNYRSYICELLYG